MTSYTLVEGFNEFDMFAFGSVLLVGGALVNLCLGLLGFFLNFTSLLAFLRVKELRTPSNFFIFNLALADFGFSCNTLVSAYASYLRYWPYGFQGCQIHAFQGMISVLAAISFLGAVAWDRYRIYCTKQKIHWNTSVTLSAVVWSLAVFWAALPLPFIGWGVFDYEPMKVGCTLDYTRGDRSYVTYVVSVMVLHLAVPLLLMHTFYSSICAYFKKTHNFKFNTRLPVRVLLFFWGPYILICMYACFENTKLLPPKLRIVVPALAKMSPVLNPVLYAYGNEFYRGGIWRFLTGQNQSDKQK